MFWFCKNLQTDPTVCMKLQENQSSLNNLKNENQIWRIHTSWFQNLVKSVAQLCPTLWDPKDCSMPGLSPHHQLLEFTQTHVHPVIDAVQPSHPLSSPFPPAFNLPQHQGLFKWVSILHQVAKAIGVSASASVLPMNIQNWFPLG